MKSKITTGITGGALVLSFFALSGFTFPTYSAKDCAVHGSQLLSNGQYNEALSEFQRARQLLDEGKDRRPIGLVLSDMGECSRKLKRYADAKNYFAQAYPFLRGGAAGAMNRDLNVLYIRWSLAFLGEGNYGQAKALLKQTVENGLGIWSYDYRDIKNVPQYVEILVQVTGSAGENNLGWYDYAAKELTQLSSRQDEVGFDANNALNQLSANKARRLGHQGSSYYAAPAAPSRPMGRDVYFNGNSGGGYSRARYGLNGSGHFFGLGGR